MKSTISLFLLLCAAPALALKPGDGVTVEFKDGSSMSGVLVRQGRRKIRLDFGGAQMSFDLAAVKRVTPKDNDVKIFQDMAKAAGEDRAKLLKAAEFARAHGLDTYYNRIVEHLGVPNQNDLDDAADQAQLSAKADDAARAKAENAQKLADDEEKKREERRQEREQRREERGDER